MAANRSIRNIFYAPNMRHLAKQFCIHQRSMATMTSSNQISKSSKVGIWNNDPSFPMPGNIGVDLNALDASSEIKASTSSPPPYQSLASAFLDLEDEAMRKNRILNQFVSESLEDGEEVDLSEDKATTSYLDHNVECKIQSCPDHLMKSFTSLFDSFPANEQLTVITLSQKTENDMTTWSEEVENEREELTGIFIDNAKEICSKIKENGHWADFIEPASGHAYYSSHRNETLFETDDRLNQLGFEIEDLGCCKVLLHNEWKSNVFVGIIFTNAPADSHFFGSL
ncbi:cobalamin trafficking protein CblD-like [Clytia hemisphaerica]|uniref:Uncharacterized protein n=1 Tax=Clytia hemisphaerica TaxID=252671 RepID=A0A7M5WN15_9CNID|eukprot:TCONS_00004414-protein